MKTWKTRFGKGCKMKQIDPESVDGPSENWTLVDLLFIGGAIALPLIIGPAALFAVGERLTAGLVASASWFVLLFEESPMAANLKHEVSRRVA